MAETAFCLGVCSSVLVTMVIDYLVKPIERRLCSLFRFRTELPGLEFSEPEGLVASRSPKAAFNEIMEALKDDEINMIGVWGMGGVGKTTLVNEVVRKAKESQLFKIPPIKVVVSRTPNIEDIQITIAESLGLNFEKTTEARKADELCLRLEKEEKVLIILDDMWNKLSLNEIGIPPNANGKRCKILLTTRRGTVCESMHCQVRVPIVVLEEDEAWKLFKNTAEPDERFSMEAQKVARECKGLPLAIITLASALKDTKTKKEWELALKKLETNRLLEIGNIAEDEKNAYMCIKTSYDSVNKKTNKTCFLLCALYPEDHSIDVENLVRHAWALRLYDKADSVDEVRCEVLVAVADLKDSCLLLEDIERKVKLHDMVRDVALWIASKEESGFVINSEHCKAISFLNYEEKKFPESFVQSNLEILLLRNCELPGACLQWTKNLKVLSLTAARDFPRLISLYPLKSLHNLRALNLENFEDFSFLRELRKLEIFSLRGLGMDAEGLANQLVWLENLKMLDLSGCHFRSSFPGYVIEKLSNLEELYLGYGVSKDILAVIKLSPGKLTALSLSLNSVDIRKDYVFPKLERYDITIYDDSHSVDMNLTEKSWNILKSTIPYKVLVSLLPEKLDLESLVLRNGNTDDFVESLRDKSLKLSNLKLLHLQQNESKLSCLTELPNKQVRLEVLVELEVVNFSRLKSLFPLPVARELVRLETLEIRECNELKQIVSESEGNEEEISSPINLCFPKLRKLEVGNCEGLEYIFPTLMAPQGIQSLTLSIKKCRQLKQLIRLAEDGLENDLLHQQLELLRSLPSISVSDCPLLTDSVLHLDPTEAYLEEVRLSAFKESFSRSKGLQLRAIEGLECLVDNTPTQNGPTSAFTNLETLCKGQPPQGFLGNLKQLVLWCKNFQDQPLSNLQYLRLCNLPELSWIFKGPAHCFSLHSLKVVNIRECRKLKSLFSTSLILSLQLLEELVIEHCDELKALVAEMENDGEIEAQSFSHLLCLPKLKKLKIGDCPKLEYGVAITLDQGLVALASLSISRCGELKQVFCMPEENHGEEHQGILQLLLPSLEDLQLESLDNLTSFLPENYIVKASALKSFKVEGCPRLMKFPIQQANDQLKLKGVLSSAFKDLLCNTKHLTLDYIGGPKNLAPDVVGIEYLEGLTSLHIDKWDDVECLVDSTLTEAMLGSKYKGQPPKLLSNLEHLQLKHSRSLRWIVKGFSNCVNFHSLKVLRIIQCHELEYMFPLSVLQILRLLEELEIEDCPKLKSIFKGSDDDDIGIESNTLCLENLKIVKIKECESLEYVFPHALARGFPRLQKLHLKAVGKLRSIVAENRFLEAPDLEILYISGCSEITNFAIRKQYNYHSPLKELVINCESEDAESCNMVNTELRERSSNFEYITHFEQLFESQGGNFLSTLGGLCFVNLTWLRDIWKAPIHVATNLRHLKVSGCNNLARIFPLKLIPHLPQLVTLWISSCRNLKRIISNGDDDILASSSSSQAVQLMEMKMIFPKLKEIYLSELSSIESFSPGGYHLEFPCLESLRVYDCSNMITIFTVDYIKLTVHAKTDQASRLGDASSPPKDIYWTGRKPTSLPQYVEEAREILPLK